MFFSVLKNRKSIYTENLPTYDKTVKNIKHCARERYGARE